MASTKKKPKALTNTQKGNPRKDEDYTVKRLANGIKQHVYKNETVTVKPKPKAKKSTVPKSGTPTKPKATSRQPWYQGPLTEQQNSITNALADPLKPVTGKEAMAFAKALQATQIAPVLQQFDRQEQQVAGRGRETTARINHAGQLAQQMMGNQIADFGQSQNQSRIDMQAAGAGAQERLAQHWAAADRTAAVDAEVRGQGLDAGQAAQRAQELANARARGERDTQIAVQGQLAGQQAGDALMRQIAAATQQQQGERLGQAQAATSAQLRDVNEGRGRALTEAQQGLANTLMTLQQRNTESALGQAAIRGDAFEAELKARGEATAAKAKAAESKAERDLKMRIAQLNADRRSSDQEKRLSAQRELTEIRTSASGQRAVEKYERDQREKRQADQKKKREKASAFDSRVDAAVTNALVQRRLKTADRKDPLAVDRALRAAGVEDGFTRNIIVERHTTGDLSAKTRQAYRRRYNVDPPKEWTTKRSK